MNGALPARSAANPDFTRLKKAGPIMNSWNEDDLRAIAESHDLYISRSARTAPPTAPRP